MVFWPRYYFVTTYARIRTQGLPHPNTSHFLVQRPQTATGPSARMRAYLSAVICVSAPPPPAPQFPTTVTTVLPFVKPILKFGPMSLNDVCVYIPAWFGSVATLAVYLLAKASAPTCHAPRRSSLLGVVLFHPGKMQMCFFCQLGVRICFPKEPPPPNLQVELFFWLSHGS